jgi:hypothetical protein
MIPGLIPACILSFQIFSELANRSIEITECSN